MFKESFKFYKAKKPPPNLKDVINQRDDPLEKLGSKINIVPTNATRPDLTPPHLWEACEIHGHPGLILIRNPFTPAGQRYWISRLVKDYPKPPNRTNLQLDVFGAATVKDWFTSFVNNSDELSKRKLQTALRWSTLGYHYNWDAKTYSEQEKTEMPGDLEELSSFFARCLNYIEFNAQAVIVNYYPLSTTLAGHVDNSERDLEAPLLSISFGQKAIFLIGGHEREEKPDAMFLNSGDVLVMAGKSRLCYHAVPRIIAGSEPTWCSSSSETEQNTSNLSDCKIERDVWNSCSDQATWKVLFEEYLAETRLNINLRQNIIRCMI